MIDTIRKLVEAYGPSGHEDTIRAIILEEIDGLAGEVSVDAMGSIIAWKRSGQDGAAKVMLSAHMDEIGVMVTHVDDQGFLRFTNIGGLATNTLHGNRVVFEDGTVGVIGVEAEVGAGDAPKLSQLFIDVASEANGNEHGVRVGDAAGFLRPLDVRGSRLVAKSMDNRISCAIQIELMRQIKDSGMLASPEVIALLEQAAERAGVPTQREVLERGSTDAASMQLVRAGVRAGCLSIPCRFIHTTSETVDLNDVQNAVTLLAALLREPVQVG